MGIKFSCPHCKAGLNVKSELAGKRGRCPHCQEKIEIPTEGAAGGTGAITVPAVSAAPAASQVAPGASASGAAAAPFVPAQQAAAPHGVPQSPIAGQPADGAPLDAISEAPQMQWYVMPPGATSQYGPAVGEEFRVWLREGRVAADTLVWRQDWPEWKPAGLVFPELQALAAAHPAAAAPAAAAPAAAAPTAAAPAAAAPAMAPMAPAGYAIPTAAGALPTAVGAAPMAFSGGMPGMPVAGAVPGGFPPPPSSPTMARRGPYRKRSNTGPMVAIAVLVLAMIPLSYFVWKVISEQLANAPAATSPAQPAE